MITNWIIQTNGGSLYHRQNNVARLINACDSMEIPYLTVDIKANSKELPEEIYDVKRPFVFYGLNTLILNAYNDPKLRAGIFYHPNRFTIESYNYNYEDLMLNYDTEICSCEDFINKKTSTEQYFIRPKDDLKAFTGSVMSLEEFEKWYIQSDKNNFEISISSPKNITMEWRLFIVDTKVISGSEYKPTPNSYVASEVIAFAQRAAANWSPADIYVMDVALSNDELKIIELNCFNGSSFYVSNIEQIVRTVSLFVS